MAADGVLALYEQSLAKRGFVSDPAQWRAVERLQRLYEEWSGYKARRSSALTRLLVKPPLPKGVYLWGSVGRGKSFLTDAFYLCVPLVRKRRVHFHHFMLEARLGHSHVGEEDLLLLVVPASDLAFELGADRHHGRAFSMRSRIATSFTASVSPARTFLP